MPSKLASYALTVAVAAAAGWLAGAARPVAAAPPAPEHRVVLVEFDDYKGLEEYKALEKELGGAWRAQFAYQEVILRRAAAEGYELVQAVVPKSPSSTIFYLRKNN